MYSDTWYCNTVLYVTCCIYTVETDIFRGIIFFKTCISTTERKQIKRKEKQMNQKLPKMTRQSASKRVFTVCKGTVGIRNSRQAHCVTFYNAKGEKKT